MVLGVVGAGGHSKAIFELIKNYKKVIFFDDKKKILRFDKKTFHIYGNFKKLIKDKKKISKVIVAIGNNTTRSNYYNILKKNNFKFLKAIHKTAFKSIGVKIGNGTAVMPGCIINTDTKIGNNCIINSSSSIDHDCYIDDHTHICPGVILAGNVTIGKNCWIGLGSKIIENVVIGDNVMVAAGSVVTKNIKSNSFVKGVPAKYAKKRMAKF